MSANDRLRRARVLAGFSTASDASRHFNWPISTYSGHENGTRGIKIDAAMKYATAYGVDAGWLLTGRGREPTQTTAQAAVVRAGGFSEPTLTPFIATSDRLRTAVDRFASELAPTKRRIQTFTLKQAHPEYALLAGDILVTEAREPNKLGEIVVANVVDEVTATAHLKLRRWFGSVLAATLSEGPLPDAGKLTSTSYVVVAMIRQSVF